MQVTVQIPDDLALRFGGEPGNLSRSALEAWAAEEYRRHNLTKPDLRRLLGFETSAEIDGFLKLHDVYEACTVEDIEREVATLRRLGI